MTAAEMLARICGTLGVQLDMGFLLDETGARCQHYTYTPYSYTPRQGRTVVPQHFMDIEGIREPIAKARSDGGM